MAGRKRVYNEVLTSQGKQQHARNKAFFELTTKSMDAKNISTSNLIALLPKFFSKNFSDQEGRKYFIDKILAELTTRAKELQ